MGLSRPTSSSDFPSPRGHRVQSVAHPSGGGIGEVALGGVPDPIDVLNGAGATSVSSGIFLGARYISPVLPSPNPPLVLLPPSEGKAPGGRRAVGAGVFSRVLARQRASVRRALKVTLADEGAWGRVLGVRGALLAPALEASELLASGRPPVLPAWQRYTGVVWEHLDAGTLAAECRARILVPSGLYGITTAEDEIADYRLKFSVSLEGVGNLARFWRTPVTAALQRATVGRTVVVMLPDEHAAAIDIEALAESCHLVEVRFVDSSGSRSVGHAAKATKGAAARTLLVGGLPALEHFAVDGWTARRAGEHLEIVSPAT